MTQSDERFLRSARIAVEVEPVPAEEPGAAEPQRKMDAGTKFILILAMVLAFVVGWVVTAWWGA